MPLRSPFDSIAPASRDWRASATTRAHDGGVRPRAVAMARKHPEELGVVLRLVAVMAFFGVMATLLFWFAN